jgi:hypothetical protein
VIGSVHDERVLGSVRQRENDAGRLSVENQRHSLGRCRNGAARLKEDPVSQPGLLIPGDRYLSISGLDLEIAWSVTGRIGLAVAAHERDQGRKSDDAEHPMTHLEIPFTV